MEEALRRAKKTLQGALVGIVFGATSGHTAGTPSYGNYRLRPAVCGDSRAGCGRDELETGGRSRLGGQRLIRHSQVFSSEKTGATGKGVRHRSRAVRCLVAWCAGVSTRRGLAGAPDMCGQWLLAAGVAAVEIVTAVNGPTSDVETGAFIRCSRACRHRKVRLLADARAAEGDRHSR